MWQMINARLIFQFILQFPKLTTRNESCAQEMRAANLT